MNVKQINSISIFFARSAKYTTDAKKMIGSFTVLMINPVSPGKSPILNKIIVMAEQLYVHASADRHRVQVQFFGQGSIQPEQFANNFIYASKQPKYRTIDHNPPNTRNVNTFVRQQQLTNLTKSRNNSQIKQQINETIHKVPGPIRKALRIGKFRKIFDFAHYHQFIAARKSELIEEYSIKVRRLSPGYDQWANNGIKLGDQLRVKDNQQGGVIQEEFKGKMSMFDTQYHSLNKKLKMHFTEYKSVFPCQSTKIRNSIEEKINKEVNELNKKHLISTKQNFTKKKQDLPKRFRGANFLSIEPLKPAQRKQTQLSGARKNIVMPNINHTQINKRSQSLQRNTIIPLTEEELKQSNLLSSSQHLPPAHIRTQSDIKPKKKQIARLIKPFVPPFERYFYRDFLWKINYSHCIEVDAPQEYQKNFKVFIGPGNNRMLVKGLMKRRNWWTLTEKSEDCHFAWTQIKIPDIYKNQKKGRVVTQQSSNLPQTSPQLFAKQADNNEKILNSVDLQAWKKYFIMQRNIQLKISEQMNIRKKHLRKHCTVRINQTQLKIHNHLQYNYVIGNKKALFYTMNQYYQLTQQNVFDFLPTTFHIQSGLDDPTYMRFLNSYYEKAKLLKKQQKEQGQCPPKKIRNVWIVKPGEFTNRGTGITVCLTLDEVKNLIKTKQKHANGNVKTYIVQSYLDRPFLYNRRKFDIRHYMMITSINGIIRGYWYQEGYIRTTSFQFTLKTNSTGIHLTNDAIQKYLPEYGKYQKGNKLSYADFQKYLQKQYGKKYNFYLDVYPVMKKMATDAVRASFLTIDKDRRQHNFQIFGMDFMIDEDFHPWLIQINTNPCLQLSCPLLGRIIPAMVQNALQIGLDPLFPPPINIVQKTNYLHQNILQTNRFELVFDQTVDGPELQKLYNSSEYKIQKEMENISDDDEVYEDEGKQWEQNQ